MKQTDVIIIGAGAAGLMAAYTLVNASNTVIVLEARNRLGGHILTLNNNAFAQYYSNYKKRLHLLSMRIPK